MAVEKELWRRVDFGTKSKFKISNRGRLQNTTTGRMRRISSTGILNIGGERRNIKRLVAKTFIDPGLTDNDIVRLHDPDAGIGAGNLWIQPKDEFVAELSEKGKAALEKYNNERRNSRPMAELYPVTYPPRARAIAKYEAVRAERQADIMERRQDPDAPEARAWADKLRAKYDELMNKTKEGVDRSLASRGLRRKGTA